MFQTENELNSPATFTRVIVKREELLSELKLNKKAHDDLYAEAVRGYYEKVKQELQAKMKALPSVRKSIQDALAATENPNFEEPKQIQIEVPKNAYHFFGVTTAFPQSHESDYVRAIRMVELSAQDHFSLTQQEFESYVLNNWNWKEQFINTAYQYGSGQLVTGLAKSFNRTSV